MLIKQYTVLVPKIERIIWYNESVKPLKGFNYECDKDAANVVFNSGVRIDVISNLDNEKVLFDSAMLDVCKQSDTQLARILYSVHSQQVVLEKLGQNHFKLCDDLVTLYLTNPELFGINIITDKPNIRYNQNFDVQGVNEAFCDMIKGIYVSERNIVFNRFPVQREIVQLRCPPDHGFCDYPLWTGGMEGKCYNR